MVNCISLYHIMIQHLMNDTQNITQYGGFKDYSVSVV